MENTPYVPSELKRYDIYMHSDDVQFLKEDADGDYCKFYEAGALIAKLRGELEATRDAYLNQSARLVSADQRIATLERSLDDVGKDRDQRAERIAEMESAIRQRLTADRAFNGLYLARCERVDELEREASQLRADAMRWRAVVGSMRVRVLGSAGLSEPMGEYAHIGLELWTRYSLPEGTPHNYCDADRARFTQYADFAAAIAVLSPATETTEGQPHDRA